MLYYLRDLINGDFWNNETGWTEHEDQATLFTEEETKKPVFIPADSYWQSQGDYQHGKSKQQSGLGAG